MAENEEGVEEFLIVEGNKMESIVEQSRTNLVSDDGSVLWQSLLI